MDIKTALQRVAEGGHLTAGEMREVMHIIMSGQATPAQIGGLLIGLRCKGETVDEIAAAAEVMRELSVKVAVADDHLLDTCGTGGDGANTFNISTSVAFVAAAAGARVAKHGNRSVSSSSGSADVLEAAGVNLDLTPEQVACCVREIGIGFLFAPRYHGAMKYAVAPRKEMGVRTLFNLLGPLSNPASAPNQLIGVYAQKWLQPLAQVLQKLGSRHVLVVHADDGLDEISIAAPTAIAELNKGVIRSYRITPEQFGLQRGELSALAVHDAADSLKMLEAVLNNQPGPARDIVLLNAAAAIYTANITDSLQAGINKAEQVLNEGLAAMKLHQLVQLSQSLAG